MSIEDMLQRGVKKLTPEPEPEPVSVVDNVLQEIVEALPKEFLPFTSVDDSLPVSLPSYVTVKLPNFKPFRGEIWYTFDNGKSHFNYFRWNVAGQYTRDPDVAVALAQ